MFVNMLSSEWSKGIEGDGEAREAEDREVTVVYMNVEGSVDATHEFLVRGVRESVAVAFVGEYWVGRKLGLGTQLDLDYVGLGSVSGGVRIACHVLRDLVDFCELVVCDNRFVCVELGVVRIGGVYSKCGARVHKMVHWLDSLHASIGSGRWVLMGDCNAHHVGWSLDERSDPAGQVLEACQWWNARGARLVVGRTHTLRGNTGMGW